VAACPFTWRCSCAGAPSELPDDLPLVERHAVRLVVLDPSGSLLLFRTREITLPELGLWWELPGGGLEPDETYVDAAVRELREETGIGIGAAQVGPPGWRRSTTYRHRGTRRLQHEVVATVTLNAMVPALDTRGRLVHELEDYVGYRWSSVVDVTSSPERFFPGGLPSLLPRLLRGETFDQPFERWS
jgi:8-oxo-dGTP pyrophosphatase MutT (NUDIX family)